MRLEGLLSFQTGDIELTGFSYQLASRDGRSLALPALTAALLSQTEKYT